MILVADLETIVDASLPPYGPDDSGKERFPPAPYWQVVCAGLLALKDFCVVKMDAITGDEIDILTRTLGALRSDTRLVSYNGRGFDVPVITARSFRYGLDFSWLQETRGARYRFSTDGHEDLLDELSDYGAGQRSALDVWARCCGFPGKGAVDGAQVAELHAAGKLGEIAAYCLSDVVQTTAVALRFWLVNGRLDRKTYGNAARSLLHAIEVDVRVSPLLEKVDAKRFLLGEER